MRQTLREETQAALALAAAVIGAGFASGSEILRFFSAYGALSWAGCVLAACVLAALATAAALLAGRLGAGDLGSLCACSLGASAGAVAAVVEGLMLVMTAGAMLSAMGELAALALPVHHAYALGLLATLAAAGWLARRGLSAMAALGLWLLPACLVLYGLLLYRRPAARAFLPGEPLPVHIWHTLPLAVAYAAMNVALAGGVLCELGQGRSRGSVARVCCLCALVLLVLLLAANAVLLPQASALSGAALPMVLLARPLGAVGYWACIAALSLAVMSTLIALLRTLARMLMPVLPGRWVWPAALCLPLLTALVGFVRLGGHMYPVMGALSALLFAWILLRSACCKAGRGKTRL